MEPKTNPAIQSTLRHMTRRNMLLAAGGVGAATVAIAATAGDGKTPTVAGPLDLSEATPLGDGYFMVDGWVLSDKDLPARAADKLIAVSK